MTDERTLEIELKYGVVDLRVGERLLGSSSLADFQASGRPNLRRARRPLSRYRGRHIRPGRLRALRLRTVDGRHDGQREVHLHARRLAPTSRGAGRTSRLTSATPARPAELAHLAVGAILAEPALPPSAELITLMEPAIWPPSAARSLVLELALGCHSSSSSISASSAASGTW